MRPQQTPQPMTKKNNSGLCSARPDYNQRFSFSYFEERRNKKSFYNHRSQIINSIHFVLNQCDSEKSESICLTICISNIKLLLWLEVKKKKKIKTLRLLKQKPKTKKKIST
jgi:hypothetical protein